MLKLCPWKKNIIRHSYEQIGYDEANSSETTVSGDVTIDFGNCSLNACPFYDESDVFGSGCRRIGAE